MLWWLSPGEGMDAVPCAVGVNVKRAQLLKIKALFCIWDKVSMLDDCVYVLSDLT